MKQILMALFVVLTTTLFAQVNYNANTIVQPYEGIFRQGINLDYYPPYTDIELANLSAGNPDLGLTGIGAATSRPALFESFMEAWGYESRLNTFLHMENLGMSDITCIVGFPSEAHRDHTVYCADGVTQSKLFANLYTPIWDDGANGTPYNDDNYYAAYLYKTVTLYKGQVKFWEIWNEPGFDLSWNTGWRPPGDATGNWWDQDPDPCDYILNAPIEHFIRTLRISYEIIKTVDPEAYVSLAGVGYESFLDAILRNTDNPVDGTPTAEYPLGGGAYFDVMGFHTYPDIDGSLGHFDTSINDWVRYRHSDAAVDGMIDRKNNYQTILDQYGYNGVSFPEKEWIITEQNIPRVSFNGIAINGDEAQSNYIIKSVVMAMQADIRQIHPYQLADRETVDAADDEYDLMGMYLNFTGTTPYDRVVKNAEGIAYKSTSLALAGTKYDPVKTAEMNLPAGIRGGAFQDLVNDRYVYALWAKTDTDLSEVATATYSFPTSFGYEQLEKRAWDYSETNLKTDVSTTDIALSGSPLFFFDGDEIDLGAMALTCPSDQEDVIIPTGQTTANVTWELPTATTTCPTGSDINITLFTSIPSGSDLTVGPYWVIYEAEDECGHQKVCSFHILVSPEDPGEITITCPEDIIVAVPPGQDRTVVTWDDAIASTTCVDPTVTLAQPGGQPSGAEFVLGGHTIGYTAIDLCGNYETCSFLITVQSAAGSCPNSILAFSKVGELDGHGYYHSLNELTWEDANTMAQNSGGYLASINSLTENDYIQNEISSMVFIGLNDTQSEGDLVWKNGDALTYTNYNTICDWCGTNTDVNDYAEMTPWDGTWIFEGQWTKRKFMMEMNCNAESEIQFTCSEDIQLVSPTSSIVVTWDDPIATTTCETNPTVTITELAGMPSGSAFSIGTHLISYQATDDCSNIASCSFTINISPQGSDCSDMDGYSLMGTNDGHGYYLSDDNADWEEAKVLSENVGGHLVTINDQAENDLLKSMIGFEMVLIGYNDAAMEGTGAWAADSSTLDLSYDNLEENDYAVMNFWAGTWQMVNHQVAKKYVVEKVCESTPPTGCENIGGFLFIGEHGDNGYYISNQPYTWSAATGVAATNGGHLVTINTQEENDFIQDNIGQALPFIGYNDQDNEGVAAWENGEAVSFDLSLNNTDENDYAVITFWNGSWQMVNGTVYKRFVMEKGCGVGNAITSSTLSLSLEQNQFVANLTWENLTTEAVAHFLIERSKDGEAFTTIEQVENTTSAPTSYGFMDTEPLVGENFYRITSVTLTGKKRISNTKKALFGERNLVAMYPNPAGEFVMIDLMPYKGKAVDVVITDQFGKTIKSIHLDEVSAAPLKVSLAEFHNGFYQVSIQPKSGQSTTKKLVIMRAY